MENSIELKRVTFRYADYAGQYYEVNEGGIADELAKASGFEVVKKTTEHVNPKNGKKWTSEKTECSIEDGHGCGWLTVYVGLEETHQAIEIAVKEEGLLTSHAQACAGLTLQYKGGRTEWELIDDEDLGDFEAREADDGEWTIDDPDGYHFANAPENSRESAEAMAAILTRVSKRLQADAITVQRAIDKHEEETYEAECDNDNRRATFDKWKEVNGIESELEIWDCETDEKAGTPGVYEVDEDGEIRVKLELSRACREVPYIVAK